MNFNQITDEINLLEGNNRGKFPFSHSIFIDDDERGLVDTGCGVEKLKKFLIEHEIDEVINSHSHPDHSSGNWVFSNFPLKVPKEEFEFNSNVTLLSERYTERGELSKIWRKFVSEKMNFKNAVPTKSFKDQDILEFGTVKLEAIHTPGHTTGHYCFFERMERILFSFDIDFTNFGPWYGHRESDIGEFKKSIEKVRKLKPEILVSSHREIIDENIDFEFEKFLNIFDMRDERILNFLEEEKTFTEVVEEALIYRDFSFHPHLLKYWEGMMVEKHLKNLLERGLISRTEKGFVKKR